MAKWEGKAKGTPLGYQIFIFIIKTFGLNSAYCILYFVSSYYVLCSYKTTRTIYFFYKKRLQQSYIQSFFSVFRNYFVFGQTLIDRTAISFGLRNKFILTYDGREKMQDLLDKGEGGIILSGHVGNFNIARYFFDDFDLTHTRISIVVTDHENEQIKQYVGAVSYDTVIKFIVIKKDMSHIYEMNEALSNNEVLIFASDRYIEGIQYIEHDLLGKTVKFPLGPYKLAARKKKPMLFMYVMKGKGKTYNLYAREPKFVDAKIKPIHIVSTYVQQMEKMIHMYPLQWFNYYDYWEDFNS